LPIIAGNINENRTTTKTIPSVWIEYSGTENTVVGLFFGLFGFEVREGKFGVGGCIDAGESVCGDDVVGVGDKSGVSVEAGVSEGEGIDVGSIVGVGLRVGLLPGVGLGVGVGAGDGAGVAVGEAVGVGLTVGEGVGVGGVTFCWVNIKVCPEP
jgi:hypothetical protein